MSRHTAAFWKNTAADTPVERRVLWQFPDGQGELGLAIYPNYPVADLAWMSEQQMDAVTLDGASLIRGQSVAPRFLFAAVTDGSHGHAPIVTGPNHREINLVESPVPKAAANDDAEIEEKMAQAGAALLPAQLAPGDHAVGFLVRTDVLFFYPLTAINLAEEIESYQQGHGSTNDLIQELPFQS